MRMWEETTDRTKIGCILLLQICLIVLGIYLIIDNSNAFCFFSGIFCVVSNGIFGVVNMLRIAF